MPAGDEDVALYYRFVEEMMRHGDADVARRFLAADFVEHGAVTSRGGEELLRSLAARRTRLPGAVWTIELLAGVGGLVLCHTSVACPAPSGCVAHGWETIVLRVADGRLAESWRICDEWLRAAEHDGAR